MIENKCIFIVCKKVYIRLLLLLGFPRPVPSETNASVKEKSYDMVGCIINYNQDTDIECLTCSLNIAYSLNFKDMHFPMGTFIAYQFKMNYCNNFLKILCCTTLYYCNVLSFLKILLYNNYVSLGYVISTSPSC